ncbi:MAG: response regulator receiver modulated diguanylate cyclase/phosphodiesterase [Polyangiaceae bacterium]|jgi:DNA-binding response OmpR family regulator|nr:response regulator receiver modulated diguanylate cyclase/phosphodiesterase [Polyangiaceae bacterium]
MALSPAGILVPSEFSASLRLYGKADTRLSQAPFIVYTATYAETEDEGVALGLGAYAFILKPCPPEEFIKLVDDVRARAKGGTPRRPRTTPREDDPLLELYSETLIRKLEQARLCS